MIDHLSLGNFKCFRDLELGLQTANVLAGVNGAGKSTVLQGLLMLRQSWDSGALARQRLELSGPLVDLGTAGEVYCADPSSGAISVVLKSSDGHELALTCPQDEGMSQRYFLSVLEGATPLHELHPFGLFSEPFNYLHAERVGPRKVSQLPGVGMDKLHVGKFGEFAPYIVASEHRDGLVSNDAIVLPSSDGKEYRTLHFQWPLWMARLFPGFNANSAIDWRADQVRLDFGMQRQLTGQPLYVRPTNTGFGLSFALGIVVAGLVAQPKSILLVENPEAHLHPRAQSILGEFLGRVSAGGTQVLVETHSEHVVNGLRRMVKQEVLPSRALRLFFFSKQSERMEPSVTPIEVSRGAQLSEWPEGFFDQLDEDVSALLG